MLFFISKQFTLKWERKLEFSSAERRLRVRASLRCPLTCPYLRLLCTVLQIGPANGSASTHRQSSRHRRLRPVPAPQTDGARVTTTEGQTERARAALELTRRRLYIHAPAEDQASTSLAGTGARDHRTSRPANA